MDGLKRNAGWRASIDDLFGSVARCHGHPTSAVLRARIICPYANGGSRGRGPSAIPILIVRRRISRRVGLDDVSKVLMLSELRQSSRYSGTAHSDRRESGVGVRLLRWTKKLSHVAVGGQRMRNIAVMVLVRVQHGSPACLRIIRSTLRIDAIPRHSFGAGLVVCWMTRAKTRSIGMERAIASKGKSGSRPDDRSMGSTVNIARV